MGHHGTFSVINNIIRLIDAFIRLINFVIRLLSGIIRLLNGLTWLGAAAPGPCRARSHY